VRGRRAIRVTSVAAHADAHDQACAGSGDDTGFRARPGRNPGRKPKTDAASLHATEERNPARIISLNR
jgi:hypothetical protein